MKKIGIIGSGPVGQVLGDAFLKEGYEVMLGTRHTSKPEVQKWHEGHPGSQVGTFAEASSFGDILILAVGGAVAVEAIKLAGIENLASKVIIDATNPISGRPENGVLPFFTTLGHSLMEDLQQTAPKAKFVKAFNSVGSPAMYKPKFKEGKPSMFICGNDAEAKKVVAGILDAFGWETEDMGGVEAARAIEPLCMLWCIPGFQSNSWNHAFKLLRP
jgi:8-hydroxy-5-deazaflavin:NADPH oxidoreductase